MNIFLLWQEFIQFLGLKSLSNKEALKIYYNSSLVGLGRRQQRMRRTPGEVTRVAHPHLSSSLSLLVGGDGGGGSRVVCRRRGGLWILAVNRGAINLWHKSIHKIRFQCVSCSSFWFSVSSHTVGRSLRWRLNCPPRLLTDCLNATLPLQKNPSSPKTCVCFSYKICLLDVTSLSDQSSAWSSSCAPLCTGF